MFKYGEGHDGTRPLVRGEKNKKSGRRVKKKGLKKKRNKKKVQAPRPIQYSDDESIRSYRSSDGKTRSTTRIRSRFRQTAAKHENSASPSSSRQTMQSDTQPGDTNKTVSTLIPEAAADPEDPTTVNNSINAPLQQTTAGQQLAGSVLLGSQGSNGSIHRTSRTGWTQHLENNHNKNPSSQRRKISGHPLRVPKNLLYTSNTKRKRASPTASNTALRVENDIRRG